MDIEEWRNYIKGYGLEETMKEGCYVYEFTVPNRDRLIAISGEKIAIYKNLTYWDVEQYEIHSSGGVTEYELSEEEQEIKEHIDSIMKKYSGLLRLLKELKILSKKLQLDKDF